MESEKDCYHSREIKMTKTLAAMLDDRNKKIPLESSNFASLTREILFLLLEHKIHIFSPPCNILYICNHARPYVRFPELKFRDCRIA